MMSRDFCYWLQGFFEIGDPVSLTTSQVIMIKNHLNMVFAHEIDPKMGGPLHQAVLDKLHSTPFTIGTPADSTLIKPVPRC